MVLKLIWPNVAIGVNVIFEEILALKRLKHTVNSKSVAVQTKI